jgi:hypothetical protein
MDPRVAFPNGLEMGWVCQIIRKIHRLGGRFQEKFIIKKKISSIR